jgi:hypothetical protein
MIKQYNTPTKLIPNIERGYQCIGIPVLQIPRYQEPQGKNVLKVRAFLVRCACNQVVGT